MPGSQKPTPPASARACCGCSGSASAHTPARVMVLLFATRSMNLSPASKPIDLVCRLRFGKLPFAVQDFVMRPIEPHEVVPTIRDRQAVGNLAVTAAELHGDRSVRALL